MNRKLTYLKPAVITLIVMSCLFAFNPVKAEIGLKLTFDKDPLFITPYELPTQELSLTITPTSYISLSSRTKRKITPFESSYENNTISFTSSYYKRGNDNKKLIPATVDADAFYRYKRNQVYYDQFSKISIKSITSEERKKKGGLGIRVALPKRLQKLFGEGDAGLKVSGYRKIMFSGRSTWTDKDQTDAYSQSRFPTLHMDQIYRFEITGTIGTKISVRVSEDSQTDIPLANRIQIRYKGDDDDILKSIEAGNTTLSLPNKEFVGYTSQIRGLFGIKVEAQVGALTLIGIASQEKGSTEKTTISPTGEENPDITRDYEYEDRRVFDLTLPGELKNGDKILNLLVYQSVNSNRTDASLNLADFYVKPIGNDTLKFSGENINHGQALRVKKLEENAYDFFSFPDSNKHYVYFKSNQNSQEHLGYYMEVLNGSDPTDTIRFGDITDTILTLKLLCPSRSKAGPEDTTWNLMWRNCYRIAKGMEINDLNLKIYSGLTGTEGSDNNIDYLQTDIGTFPYMEILGLDQYDSKGDRNPDTYLDDNQDVYRPDWGLIIFPEREPFNSKQTFTDDNGLTTPPLPDSLPSIYSFNSTEQRVEDSKYYLQITTKSRSSSIRLNRANIIEGSESVTVNGIKMTKGVDYQIDYNFGQITLLSDAALDPNADLQIDFEYAPFFAVQKKTLMGFRADYEWSKDFRFGTTILYKSDKAQERKPKVGQETAKMVVFDVDMTLKLHPKFLTKMVDALPLIETEVPSNLAISAEVAQSHPNPNVNDVAYVDDFESSADLLSLGLLRNDWHHSGVPYPLNDLQYNHGKVLWHTPYDRPPISDIYKRETAVGEGAAQVFRMIYRPINNRLDSQALACDSLNPDNYNPNLKSWAGVMRYFGNRVVQDRAKLFEMRIRLSDSDSDTSNNEYNQIRGKIHFDFGLINEDIDNDGNADTEDKDGNGNVKEDEDLGLDGFADIDEDCYDPLTNPDPNGDNYYFRGSGKCPLPNCDEIDWANPYGQYYYEFLNGTEGNISDGSSSAYPDRETFSTNSGSNTEDSYFSFVLDFESGDADSFKIDSSLNENSWVTYRIPIQDTALLSNDTIVMSDNSEPNWNRISYVRVWFESEIDDTTTKVLEVAHWGFVQSNWKDELIYHDPLNRESEFIVATISDEDDTYIPHPDIEAYEDPNTNVREPQRALMLGFKNLDYRDSCLVSKDLYTVDRYLGYNGLQMYVYGNITEENRDKVLYFFRFGRDENNWYEYYTVIEPYWAEGNHVNINFQDLTALKDSAFRTLNRNEILDTVVSNDKYRFLGNPNIDEVRFFNMGVVNLDSTQTVTGEIWVDELRVTDVRRDVGSAARIKLNGNFADLISYNFSLRAQDPYFRGMSSATRGGSDNNLGSGKNELLYNYGITLNLNKFLPRSWNARIPVSFSYSKSTFTPLLKPNSDILLLEEVRVEEQTVAESKSISIGLQFDKKGKNPIFSVLLNRMKTRFSYRRNQQRNPNTPFSFGENYNVDLSYNMTIKKFPRLSILSWAKSIPFLKKLSNTSLGLYPESWSLASNFKRNLTITDDITNTRRSTVKRNLSASSKLSYNLFNNLSTSFNLETHRDLSDLDEVNVSLKFLKLGIETRYAQRFSASYNPGLLKFLTAQFTYSANYNDSWERSSDSRRSQLARTISVGGKLEHRLLFGGKASRGINQYTGRRRGGGRRSQAESEAVKEKEKNKKHFYDYPLKALKFLTNWIEPFKYNYSEGYNRSLPGMTERPNLSYRFGFIDNPEVETIVDSRSSSANENNSFDVTSGFDLMGGITTTIKFKKSINRDLIKAGRLNQETSILWPDLNVRIKKFRKLPLIQKYVNKFIDVFAPRTKFSRQERTTIDLSTGKMIAHSVGRSHSPLLSINFKLLRSLSLSSSYTYKENTKENFNQITGVKESTTNSYSKSLSMSTNYSFSSPHGFKIPFLGRIKFRSTVDFSLSLKINKQIAETVKPNSEPSRSTDKSEFSLSPKIAYTFSRQIRGGITMRWQDTNDNNRDRRSHVREVQLWTEIRF